MVRWYESVFLSMGLMFVACSAAGDGTDPTGHSRSSGGRSAAASGSDGSSVIIDPTDSDPSGQPQSIVATIRDLRESHPDFEISPKHGLIEKQGIVLPQLGQDGKPVLAPSRANQEQCAEDCVRDEASFRSWYNDEPGVNMAITLDFPLQSLGSGVYGFSSNAFFPIDGKGFGNEQIWVPHLERFAPDHNYHFTTEVHTEFTYQGGESFSFQGDDDLWVFINGRLAIDLGGIHVELEKSIYIDELAASHSLVVGETYPLDLFHAERHTTDSNFSYQTTLVLKPTDIR